MNIIQFPGSRKRRDDGDEIERATRLKGQLVDFVTHGPLREIHAREMGATGLEQPEFHEYVDFTDWFIFEWEDEDGTNVLDEFLSARKDLTDADRALLERWYDPIDDLFEVVEIADDGVTLRDGEGATYFTVPTNMKASELGWKPKTLVQTRILPVGDIYTLSGIQSFYSGPEMDALPSDVNLAAIANLLDEDDIEDGEFNDIEIADVRDLKAAERPKGSLAAAAHTFLKETSTSLKPATAEAHALAVSFLTHYLREELDVVRVEDLDAVGLRNFLAVWFPHVAPDRTLGATRQLLGSIGKFTAWLDRTYKTQIGREFKELLLPMLKDDLPRTIKIIDEMGRVFPFFGISQMLSVLVGDDEAEPARSESLQLERTQFRGLFSVVTVDQWRVTLRERTDGEDTDTLLTVEFPGAAANLLRPGDVVEGVFSTLAGKTMLETLDCVYCPAAGM